jgi:hypothetical protein
MENIFYDIYYKKFLNSFTTSLIPCPSLSPKRQEPAPDIFFSIFFEISFPANSFIFAR